MFNSAKEREKILDGLRKATWKWGDCLPKPKLPATFIVGQDLKKGDKAEITQGGYVVPVLSEISKKLIIRECLRYCLHRKRDHKTHCGLSISIENIEKVLKDLT